MGVMVAEMEPHAVLRRQPVAGLTFFTGGDLFPLSPEANVS